MKKNSCIRSNSGAFATLAFIGLLPIMAAIGAFAVDSMHINATRGELQKACDAGALAGAGKLYRYLEPASAGFPGGPVYCEDTARAITKLNSSDGCPVDDALDNVDVVVTFPVVPVANSLKGECKVEATITIKSIFANIIGNAYQTVSTSATAGVDRPSNTALAGGLFPLLISLSTPGPGPSAALGTLTVGQTINADWNTNLAWTAFTSHSASDVADMMANYRKPGSGQHSPPVTANQTMIDVSNGTQAGNIATLGASYVGKVVTMPVIDEDVQGSHDRLVIGFVAMRIDSVVTSGGNKSIVGTVVKADLYGTGPAPVYTAGSAAETFFTTNDLLPKPVRLLR